MTMKQLIKRLTVNAEEFLLAGEREKSAACLEILAVIKTKNFGSLRGKLIDNL